MLEIDDDPVETGIGDDLHGLEARHRRNRAEGGFFLPQQGSQAIQWFAFVGHPHLADSGAGQVFKPFA